MFLEFVKELGTKLTNELLLLVTRDHKTYLLESEHPQLPQFCMCPSSWRGRTTPTGLLVTPSTSRTGAAHPEMERVLDLHRGICLSVTTSECMTLVSRQYCSEWASCFICPLSRLEAVKLVLPFICTILTLSGTPPPPCIPGIDLLTVLTFLYLKISLQSNICPI